MKRSTDSNSKTSDGILLSDWVRVQVIAENYANAIMISEREEEAAGFRRRLLRKLNSLLKKYGERPSILATKADYLISSSRRAVLLKRAFDLAKREKDFKNMTLIAASLAELYVEEMHDSKRGALWLNNLHHALIKYPDSTEQMLYDRLEEQLITLNC